MSSRKIKQIEEPIQIGMREVLLEKIRVEFEYGNMMSQTHVCCCSIYAHGLYNKKFNKYINQVQAEERAIFYSLILPGMCNFKRPVDDYYEIPHHSVTKLVHLIQENTPHLHVIQGNMLNQM